MPATAPVDAVADRFYTWMDVQAVVKANMGLHVPSGRRWGVTVYPDQLEIQIGQAGDGAAALSVLREWLGPSFDQRVPEVQLDAPAGARRALPVAVVREPPHGGPRAFLPLFADAVYAPLMAAPRPFRTRLPSVVAFHSYKGGVGRTLHLLAMAKVLLDAGVRILLVDADIEAPGLTWWTRQVMGAADFSTLDLFAVTHAESDRRLARRLAEERTSAQRLVVPGLGGTAYVLPAFRYERQVLDVPIRPEHLTRGAGGAWIVGDLLADLGHGLGVEVVLVDLRAGVNELAGPLLFDPRVRRVLVTTASVQSVQGTAMILRELRRLQPKLGSLDPAVLLSMVTPELAGSNDITRIRESLFDAYLTSASPAEEGDGLAEDDQSSRAERGVLESGFASELLYLPTLGDAFERLSGTSVERTMREAAEQWDLTRRPSSHARPGASPAPEVATARERLRRESALLVRAESAASPDFLRTTALRALGERFSTRLPAAVVVGAKGSGKTFSYLQLVRTGSWQEFLRELGSAAPAGTASPWGPVLPWLTPQSLGDGALAQVERVRRETWQMVASTAAPNSDQIHDAVRARLRGPVLDETQWRDAWLDILVEWMGLPKGGGPFDRLRARLSDGRSLVVLFDGLEELFSDVATDPRQKVALRALCRDLPNLLRGVPNLPLGVVIMVRGDLVQYAVPQNLGQLEDLHRSYALRWNEDEALRLVAWVCLTADLPGYLRDLRFEHLSSLNRGRLEAALFPIWGERLGGPGSHEAFTANWIMAALSDYHQQLQARDVVRLLQFAADAALVPALQEAHDKRLLPPATIRAALPRCSRDKVAETSEEIPALRGIFAKFESVGPEERRLPFRPEQFGLDAAEISLLESTGIILHDVHGYYMPEIFRHGLGFGYSTGARPRVLALRRRGLPH